MDNIMHENLNKLRLISRLRERQSLYTTNGFAVYDFTITNWLYRKWTRDGKEEVIRALRDFYTTIDQASEKIITDVRNSTTDVKREKLIDTAVSLATNIRESITGLENLSKTYACYASTVSSLEGLVKDFAIVTYKQLVACIKTTNLDVTYEKIEYNGEVVWEGTVE